MIALFQAFMIADSSEAFPARRHTLHACVFSLCGSSEENTRVSNKTGWAFPWHITVPVQGKFNDTSEDKSKLFKGCKQLSLETALNAVEL